MKIYAVKDVKVGFLNPFYEVNEEVAKRAFKISIKDTHSTWGSMKDDLELWELGEFDETTGKLIPCEMNYLMGGKDVSLE